MIFAASIALGEILVAERRFVPYGLAPILYNAGLALGTLLFAGSIGILGPAIGAIIGALLHLLIRAWGIRRLGFPIRPRLQVGTGAVREFILYPWGDPRVRAGNGAEFAVVDRDGNIYGGEPRSRR